MKDPWNCIREIMIKSEKTEELSFLNAWVGVGFYESQAKSIYKNLYHNPYWVKNIKDIFTIPIYLLRKTIGQNGLLKVVSLTDNDIKKWYRIYNEIKKSNL